MPIYRYLLLKTAAETLITVAADPKHGDRELGRILDHARHHLARRTPRANRPIRVFAAPEYLLVAAEMAVPPLALGAVAIAATFSVLNLALLAQRIRIEDRVLAPRRAV